MGIWVNQQDGNSRNRSRRALRSESLERREVLSGNGLGGAIDFVPAGDAMGSGNGDCDTVQVGLEDCDPSREQFRAGQRGRFGLVDNASQLDPGIQQQRQQQGQEQVAQGQGNGNGQSNGAGQGGGQVGTDSLSDHETADLLHMREEEKLARDVYQVLGDRYDAAIFDNIAASEQRHMNAVKNLLDKYELADPAEGNGVGEFTSPELQELYDELVARGEQSLVDAYQVGVDIEVLDIADLEKAIAATDNDDIHRVYDNLLAGSQSHLAAFTAALEGVTPVNPGEGDGNGGNGNGNGVDGGNGAGNGGVNGDDQVDAESTPLRDGQGNRQQRQRRLDQQQDQCEQESERERDREHDRVFEELGRKRDGDQQHDRDRDNIQRDPAEELARDRVRKGVRRGV